MCFGLGHATHVIIGKRPSRYAAICLYVTSARATAKRAEWEVQRLNICMLGSSQSAVKILLQHAAADIMPLSREMRSLWWKEKLLQTAWLQTEKKNTYSSCLFYLHLDALSQLKLFTFVRENSQLERWPHHNESDCWEKIWFKILFALLHVDFIVGFCGAEIQMQNWCRSIFLCLDFYSLWQKTFPDRKILNVCSAGSLIFAQRLSLRYYQRASGRNFILNGNFWWPIKFCACGMRESAASADEEVKGII